MRLLRKEPGRSKKSAVENFVITLVRQVSKPGRGKFFHDDLRSPGIKLSIDLPEWVSGDVTDVDELVVIYHNWDEIRRLMWDYVSIVRTSKRLQRAATRLQNLQRDTGVLLEFSGDPGVARAS